LEKLIKMGAEANIYLDYWNDIEVIRKIRRPKPYWRGELDKKIRRSRTIKEAEYMSIVKRYGVLTPIIYYVDPFNGEIIMEYVNGTRMKDLFEIDLRKALLMLNEAGRSLARMHAHNILHGDPTTSNFIVRDGKLYFIDFGLAFRSTRLEDKSVDVHLLKQVMKSAHSDIFDKGFGEIIEGYGSVCGNIQLEKTLDNIREIEKRGRYAAPD
jgi:TP53 regulating kinase-like protein